MELTIKKVDLYSQKEKKMASFTLSLVEDETRIEGQDAEGKNIFGKVIEARYNDEVYRFSPNATDKDFEQYSKQDREDYAK